MYGEKGGYQMKMRTSIVVSVSFIIVLGFLLTVPVHAQVEYGDWVGLWLKGTTKDKGLMVDDLGTDKAADKINTYAYVQALDIPQNLGDPILFTALLVQFDDESGTWMEPVPYTATVVGGTPLDYVVYGFIPPDTVPGIEILAIILSINGKEKNGELTKGTVKSVSGTVIYDLGGGMYFSAFESLKLKSIPDSKVPDEVSEKVFPP
jgi:hypothetical protein